MTTDTTDHVTDTEWELGSGLALDGADVEITGFEFGFNANISPDAVCANVTFTDLESGEDYEQSFSTGKGFDASRDGSELVSARPKKINNNSNFGRLISSVVEVLDGDPSALGGSPKLAGTWLGTRWSMGTKQVESYNPTTGEKKDRSAFIVTAYLGRDGEEGTKAKATAKPVAAAKKATAKAAPAAAEEASDCPNGIDEDLWAQLIELANNSADHDTFVEAALDLDGVEGNRAASKAVMGTKAGSVWAAKG